MTSAATRFDVPATAESRVRQLVEATNARAAVHQLAAYSLAVSPSFLADYHDTDGRLIGQRPTVTVTISGAIPRHQGWTVVARLDHDEEGETLLSLFPGLPEQDAEAVRGYRAIENFCHGCKIARHRTATYLARHENGEFRQLGTTCVEPYTGLPIKGLEALWRFGTLKDSDWDGGEGGIPADLRVPVAEVLRVTAAIVTQEGRFYSRSEQWKNTAPTADLVESYFFDRKAPQEWRAAVDAEPDAPSTAAAVREWAVQGYGSPHDYRHKVGQLAKVETVSPRHLPTLVSAIAGWHRDQEKEATERAAQNSKPQGTVGERICTTATVTTVIELEGRTYGYNTQRRRLVKFQDGEGNVFVWFSSAATVPGKGDEVELTGTVKDHSIYGETAQTVLTRCRITERQPVAA
ncbi:MULTISPECIES: hypothetical protein [unclassified Streptomyces]|uniref:hypothetical protein n=1 Tax=unclassified Streptomyces TaxID=2593676 RepID=UPI001BE5359E|nr:MULTISPECIES: hypothetical protein [unclassified Streptomyces]MBT2406772.1 hypothetical protein [Streptomyces sp. ISL-21]MBT2610392.1 hypothetical protein [Streptomyces sp. ISL-87]